MTVYPSRDLTHVHPQTRAGILQAMLADPERTWTRLDFIPLVQQPADTFQAAYTRVGVALQALMGDGSIRLSEELPGKARFCYRLNPQYREAQQRQGEATQPKSTDGALDSSQDVKVPS